MEQQERDRLIRLETQHKERHEENKTALKKIDSTVSSIWDKLDGLQCQTHKEMMKGIKGSITLLWTMLISVVILGIGLGVMQNIVR